MSARAATVLDLDEGAAQRLARVALRTARLAVLAHAALLPVSIAGMQITLGVAVAALGAARLAGVRLPGGPLVAPVALLTAAAAGSVLVAWGFAGIPPASLFGATLWKTFVSPLVVAAACEAALPGEAWSSGRRRALACVTAWACACALAGAIGVVQPWTGLDALHAIGLHAEPERSLALATWPGHYRASGFFSGYVVLPLALVPPLGLVVGLAALAPLPRWHRALLAVAGALGTGAILLTLARTPWGSLAAIAAVLVLVGGWRRGGPVVAAAAIAAVLALAVPGVRARLEQTDANGRATIWRVCADVVRDHPLTGVGLGNFPAIADPYFARHDPTFPVRTACHDAALTALVEGGPLLLAALLAYWILLARAFLRARRQRDPLGRAAAAASLVALAGAATNTLFHDPFHVTHAGLAMGFAIGAGWALARPRPGDDAGRA